MLHSYGYTVVSAANAGEALVVARLFTKPIHLLLTDVMMPGMNGKILAERVKPLKPEMKVLYMSGHTNEAIGHGRRPQFRVSVYSETIFAGNAGGEST